MYDKILLNFTWMFLMISWFNYIQRFDPSTNIAACSFKLEDRGKILHSAYIFKIQFHNFCLLVYLKNFNSSRKTDMGIKYNYKEVKVYLLWNLLNVRQSLLELLSLIYINVYQTLKYLVIILKTIIDHDREKFWTVNIRPSKKSHGHNQHLILL